MVSTWWQHIPWLAILFKKYVPKNQHNFVCIGEVMLYPLCLPLYESSIHEVHSLFIQISVVPMFCHSLTKLSEDLNQVDL